MSSRIPTQSSRLFVKLCADHHCTTDQQLPASTIGNNGVICDPNNCRVCVKVTNNGSNKEAAAGPKPKWWKAIVKNTSEEWKDVAVESVFPPETSNRCIASECLPLLINAALEGSSTCLAISSCDSDVSDLALYGKGADVGGGVGGAKSLLATSISWLFDLIDTFRVTRSSARFSVRVSAMRMFINAGQNQNSCNNSNSNSNNINSGEITTTDLLEHIAQDGSSGDIPKLLGIGRLAGPRELRASSAKQALSYVDTALRTQPKRTDSEAAAAESRPCSPGVFVFSLNVYQYQIERQPNGTETISGGRGQFHFVDLSKAAGTDATFSTLQEKIVGALSKSLAPSNLPTAFASLTGQVLREFQRCRLCHFLALISPQNQNSRRVLELFDVASTSNSTAFSASSVSSSKLMPKSASAKRRQSPQLHAHLESQRQTSASFDSATLPRLASFSSTAESHVSMSSSINGRLSNCVSGSELSIHTVIHRPSPPPQSSRLAFQQLALNKMMQTSITSQTSNGVPPSLASSHFSNSLTRPSAYSDSETESVCRLRQPSLAPMQPLGATDFHELARFSDDDQLPLDRRLNGTSVSANCSPAKQAQQPSQQNQHHHHHHHSSKHSSSGRYARLKRFASSRMKRQMEQQKMWAMMAAASKVPPPPPATKGDEIWIDGPGALSQQKLQQVEDWIDGPMSFRNLQQNSKQVLQQHALNLQDERMQAYMNQAHNHRSLPRMRRHHPSAQQQQQQPQQQLQATMIDGQRPLAVMRNKKGARTGHRPPSISCSSENLFVDSGYFAESTRSGVPYSKNRLQQQIVTAPPNLRMDSLMENFDFFQQQQKQQQQQQAPPNNMQRFKTSQQNVVAWSTVQDMNNLNFAVNGNDNLRRFIAPGYSVGELPTGVMTRPISESKKVQSPFMRLKNKILGKKQPQQPQQVQTITQVMLPPMAVHRPGANSVPSSPAIIAKRQHHVAAVSALASVTAQQQQQQQQNRMSRLTDTSDSGNDSGVALYAPSSGVNCLNVVTTGPDDAVSTSKSLSGTSSSSATPPSPVPGALTVNPPITGQKTNAISSGSVCSHSSGRGSSTSLLSHSAGGSQPSIAESAEHRTEILMKTVIQPPPHLSSWAASNAALSSVEEELASAVSALHQTFAPNQQQQQPTQQQSSQTQSQQQQQQQRRQQPPQKLSLLNMQPSSGDRGGTPRQQRRHLKLDISEVSESPSRDELLCLESLEQQLLS